MKVKTREDALLHCFDLWLWLAVTGSANKSEWPGWEFNGGYLDKCGFNCPACHYAEDCNLCPIKWADSVCYYYGSEYSGWAEAETYRIRSKWALRIATLALEALFDEHN